MKTIGLLGGMSWESTATYYRIINERFKEKLGGLHSAIICLYSVDFDEIEKLQNSGNWAETAKILTDASKSIMMCDLKVFINIRRVEFSGQKTN